MKRDFLQNFKVNDQPLPKEIIDEIMAENGRDIEAVKKPFADYDSIKEQLQTAKDGLKAFEGVDIAQLQSKVTELQGKLDAKDTEWQGKLADMEFDHALESAITGAKGKSVKAIRALLDMDTLKGSKNQGADSNAARESLLKASGYPFDDGQIPPPDAGGTGTGNPKQSGEPMSLAGALREKYNIM